MKITESMETGPGDGVRAASTRNGETSPQAPAKTLAASREPREPAVPPPEACTAREKQPR